MAKEIKVPFVRSAYNYDRDAASDESGLMCSDPSLAQQQFREESDINTIVKRFNLTGQLPEQVSMPTYGDFDVVVDYKSALDAVIAADAAFMALPAHIRARFDNDAGAYVDFCSDLSKNAEEAVKLGLLPESAIARVREPNQGETKPLGAEGVDTASASV